MNEATVFSTLIEFNQTYVTGATSDSTLLVVILCAILTALCGAIVYAIHKKSKRFLAATALTLFAALVLAMPTVAANAEGIVNATIPSTVHAHVDSDTNQVVIEDGKITNQDAAQFIGVSSISTEALVDLPADTKLTIIIDDTEVYNAAIGSTQKLTQPLTVNQGHSKTIKYLLSVDASTAKNLGGKQPIKINTSTDNYEKLHGYVKWEASKSPIEGCKTWFLDENAQTIDEVQTNANGEYELWVPTGSQGVVKYQYNTNIADDYEVTSDKTQCGTLEIPDALMQEAVKVNGLIRDVNGHGVANCKVEAMLKKSATEDTADQTSNNTNNSFVQTAYADELDSNEAQYTSYCRTYSDANGNYSLSVPKGYEGAVTYRTSSLVGADYILAKTTQDIVIKEPKIVREGVKFSWFVHDEEGHPLNNVIIYFGTNDYKPAGQTEEDWYEFMTSADGCANDRLVPKGATGTNYYELADYSADVQTSITASGDKFFDVEMHKTGTATDPTIAQNLVYNRQIQVGLVYNNDNKIEIDPAYADQSKIQAVEANEEGQTYEAWLKPKHNCVWADAEEGHETETRHYTWTIAKKPLSDDTQEISDITPVTYTSEALTPSPANIRSGGYSLTKNTDYEIEWSNNKDVKLSTETGAPQATITGKGNYTGSVIRKFTINKQQLTEASVAALDPTDYLYDGQEHKPNVPKVTNTLGNELAQTSDFTVTYMFGDAQASQFKDKGNYKIVITGAGNYSGSVDRYYTITEHPMTVVEHPYTNLVFNNSEQVLGYVEVTTPASGATIKYKDSNNEYTLDNPVAKDAGEYTIEYKVTAENYTTYTGTFTNKAKIAKKSINGFLIEDVSDATYSGLAHQPTGFTVCETSGKGGLVLLNTEYSTSYSNNINVTDAAVVTVTATGNNYTDSCSTTFKITKAPLTITTGGNTSETAFSYDATAHTNPNISITGLVNNEVVTAQTTGTATNANLSNPVENTYSITAGQALLVNYEVTNNLGKIYVKPKDLTVTPTANQYKYTDQSDPVLTYSCNNSGIANEVPAYSGELSREEGAAVGSYKIKQNTLAFKDNTDNFRASNYTMHFQEDVLFEIRDIVYCDLTFESSKTWTYDGSPHSITATSTTTGATITYKVGEEDWTTTPPAITDVGTLSVTVKASKGSSEIRDKEGEYTLEIKPLEVQTRPVVASNAVFGKTTPDIDCEVIDHPELKESVSVNYKSDRALLDEANKTYEIYAYDTEEVQGNYKVNAQKGNLTVDPANISSDDFTLAIKSGQTEYTYDGTNKAPEVNASYDITPTQTLEKDTDFSLTYTRNLNAANKDDDDAPLVNIAGKGNYTGTVSLAFTIKKAQSSITLSSNSGEYKVGIDGTFTVSSYTGDGQISVRSLDTAYVTADIDLTSPNKTVTVHPRAATDDTTQTIRVTIAESQNYESASADHSCTITERLTNVAFNCDGGTPQVANRNVVYGQRDDAIQTTELPQKEHYVFEGFWYKKDVSTPEVQYYDEFGTLTKAWDIDLDQVTLTAHWKKQTYYFNFIPDDGLQFKDTDGNVITGIVEIPYGTDYKFTIEAKENFYLVKNVDKVTHDITEKETSRTTITANEGQYSVLADNNYTIDAYALLPLTVEPSTGTTVQFHPVYTGTMSENDIEFYNNTTKIAAPVGGYKWTDVTSATHYYLKKGNVSFATTAYIGGFAWGEVFVPGTTNDWELASKVQDSFASKYLNKGIALEAMQNDAFRDPTCKEGGHDPEPFINNVSTVDIYNTYYRPSETGGNLFGRWQKTKTSATAYCVDTQVPGASWSSVITVEGHVQWLGYGVALTRTFGDIHLSFDTNGSSSANPEPVTGTYETSVTLPTGDDLVPPSSDYVFTGWNTKADGTGIHFQGGEQYKLSYSTTLYARWGHPDEIDPTYFYAASRLLSSDSVSNLKILENETPPKDVYAISYDGNVVMWKDGNTIYITNKKEGHHIYAPADCSYLISGTESAPNTLIPSLTMIDMTGLNTSHVTSFKGMFKGCVNLQVLDISNWQVDNTDDVSYMFKDCTGLNTIKASIGTNWSNVTTNTKMFDQCKNLIGGNHTCYDDSRNSGKMARIDGNNYGAAGSTTPEDYFGYFTPTGEGVKTISYNCNNGCIRQGLYWWRDTVEGYTTTIDATNGTISGWATQKSRPEYNQFRIPSENDPFEFLYWSDDCSKVQNVNYYNPGDSVSSIPDGSTIGAVWLKDMTFRQHWGTYGENVTATKYYPAFDTYDKLPNGTRFYDSSKNIIDSSSVATMAKVSSVNPQYIAVPYGAHVYGFSVKDEKFSDVFTGYETLESPYYSMTKANIKSVNSTFTTFYFADKYMNYWKEGLDLFCYDKVDMECMINNMFNQQTNPPQIGANNGVKVRNFYNAYYQRIKSDTGHSSHKILMRNNIYDGKVFTFEPEYENFERDSSYSSTVSIILRRIY